MTKNYDMAWEYAVLVIIAGLVCGFINTLAGSGSLISLPILMFIGLDPHTANGTNRIGIFFQNIVSSITFFRKKVLDVRLGLIFGAPAIVGSVIGAFIVLELHERIVEITVGVILLIMLIPILLKPGQWLKKMHGEIKHKRIWLKLLLMFAIGIYGGFIQAGVGIFLLSALVLNSGYDLVRANALKVFITLIFTPFALTIFIMRGQVDFGAGLLLALGNMAGAFIASNWAVSWGPKFVRYVLITVIIFASIRLLLFA